MRNLAFGVNEANEGDILIAVSDGVHDNLDPATLGMVPSELGLEGNDHADWKKVPKGPAALARTNHMCKTLGGIIAKLPRANPSLVAKAIVKHCQEITDKSREWMEQNPEGSLTTASYKEFPGKMDHCSCIAIRIGKPISGDHKVNSLKPSIFPY